MYSDVPHNYVELLEKYCIIRLAVMGKMNETMNNQIQVSILTSRLFLIKLHLPKPFFLTLEAFLVWTLETLLHFFVYWVFTSTSGSLLTFLTSSYFDLFNSVINVNQINSNSAGKRMVNINDH